MAFENKQALYATLDEYTPDDEQLKQLDALSSLQQECTVRGIAFSVLGGYGLDGLYGKLTRKHDDVDILVEEGKLIDFKLVLEDLGYVPNPDEEEKEDYIHPDLPHGFDIEFTDAAILREYPDISMQEVFPENNNAQLGTLSFKTPVLEVHKKIIEIQNKRKEELGWDDYDSIKASNQRIIIEVLESKEV